MPPISKLIDEIATVNNTKVTDIAILFEREWKNLSQNENNNPITNPKPNDNTISNNGSNTIDKTSTFPKLIDLATPKLTAKTTKPTASSMATTGNKTSVTGPLALYCFTTIKVAAGAVAVATAPNTIAADKENLSGIIKCNVIKNISTIIVVNIAWKIPIIVALFPISFNCLIPPTGFLSKNEGGGRSTCYTLDLNQNLPINLY